MSLVLVVYDTKYGQTQRIANYVGEVVRRRGHTANVVHVASANAPGIADGIVVLAPVFASKHMKSIRRFINEHHKTLGWRPSAFFSVSGAAGSTVPDERVRAQAMASDFVASTPWRPHVLASFGGAMAYPRYNWLLRRILQSMAKKNGGPTDTSRVHELTDWTAVERATLDLLEHVERKTASVPPAQVPAEASAR
jgi:menaquinone-dependent protoporphyrinogen oxidase